METQKTKDSVTLLAVGDIMLGDSPYSFGFGVASAIQKHGPLYPFVHVSDTLKRGELVFGNLELVVSGFDWEKDSLRQMQHRGQPDSVKGIADANFHVLSLATNHTMQHGRAALEETQHILEQNNIKYTGIEIPEKDVRNECFIERSGLQFCFLNYNFRPQQYFVDKPAWREPTKDLIKTDIARVRNRADFVILSLHWGDEFIDYPSPEQVVLAHELIDGGADVILGHHSHTVQGVENYNGGIIAYSLGNFVAGMWQYRQRKSMILKCELSKSGKNRFDVLPVVINERYQPEIVSGEVGVRVQKELQDLNAKISPDLSLMGEYQAEVARNLKRYRREVNWFYLTHLHRYKRKHLLANVRRIIRNRLGK